MTKKSSQGFSRIRLYKGAHVAYTNLEPPPPIHREIDGQDKDFWIDVDTAVNSVIDLVKHELNSGKKIIITSRQQ